MAANGGKLVQASTYFRSPLPVRLLDILDGYRRAAELDDPASDHTAWRNSSVACCNSSAITASFISEAVGKAISSLEFLRQRYAQVGPVIAACAKREALIERIRNKNTIAVGIELSENTTKF